MSIFEGKDILVTGGCGTIGSEIVKQLLTHQPQRIRVFDQHEASQFALGQKLNSHIIQHLIGDIRDAERLKIATEGVDMIFHAAALKHVPLCEYNPFEAVQTNVIGTQNIVNAALANQVKRLVGISTDKAVNPIGTMGATKLLSEKMIVNAPIGTSNSLLSCVRFGNVLDSVGSVIPTFRQQIIAGGPVTITSPEMTRFFITIPEAANLILHFATEMQGREIFVLKMFGLRIMDMAQVMIEELAPRYGKMPADIDIKIVGIRPGEKLYETLFSEEERPFITETEKTFVLRSSVYDDFPPNYEHAFQHDNSSHMRVRSKEEIRQMLKEAGIV